MLALANIISIFAMMALFTALYLTGTRSSEAGKEKKFHGFATLSLVVASINYLLTFFPSIRLRGIGQMNWIASIIIGLCIGAFGYSFQIQALKEKKQYGEGELIRTGAYRFIRHPWAFHEILCFFMLALLVDSLPLVLISFLWFPVFSVVLILEEKKLIEKYGDEYITYKRESWFLFPRFLKAI